MHNLKDVNSLKRAAKKCELSRPIIVKVKDAFVLRYFVRGELCSLIAVNARTVVLFKTLGAALSAASKIEPLCTVEFVDETDDDVVVTENIGQIEKQREATHIKKRDKFYCASGRSDVSSGIKLAIDTLQDLLINSDVK